MDLDDQAMDSDKITKLLKVAPTAEETGQLLKYDGDKDKLTNVEQFLLCLTEVPSLTERLECMMFKGKFDQEFRDLNKNI